MAVCVCLDVSNDRNYDFNVNALYDLREDQKNKSTEFYLSPYMSTYFELTLKSNPDEGFVEVPITRRYGNNISIV